MRKLLLTASLLIASMTASFAQTWNVGQEITDQVKWGNLSFENNPMDFWKYEASKGSTTQTGGLFEVYDGADADLYQYVELPAGMYRLECQGYYRCGNSWAEDPGIFNTEAWQDNAVLYVQNGAYNIDSDEFLAARTFKNPLMPRLFDFQDSQIYDMAAAGDESTWDMSDGNYGDKGWGPCSVPGSLAWFNAGKYKPYSDAETGVKYNTVNFFLAQDGYVRIGVSKKEAKEADSFMATNFKLYYEGEAGEAAELAALQDEIKTYIKNCEAIQDNNPGLLYTLINDALIENEYDASYVDNLSKEECLETLEGVKKLYMEAAACLAFHDNLVNAVKGMKNLAGSTNYPGKAAFEAAIEKANSYLDENFEINYDTDSFASFETAYDALIEARGAYLQSQEAKDGMYDYTAFISYPWFCLPDYEPVWSEEEGRYIPNEAALAHLYDEAAGDEVTYAEKDDVNGTIKNIASGVNVNGKKGTPGVWYQEGTEGGGLEVYWNDKYTCIKKWDMPHEGYHDVSQLVAGIPNGYYKLKAFAQTWSNDWNGNCRNQIYIKSSTMESFSPYLQPGGWWGNDVNQWQEIETDMIQVTDGEVLISSRDNGFAAFTGFRLYYFGEKPDFTALLAPKYESAKEAVSELVLQGDSAIVKKMIDALPEKVEDEDAFALAVVQLKEINEYIKDANSYMAGWDLAGKYEGLMDRYESATEVNILTPAWTNALEFPDREDATYTQAQQLDKDYAAYEKYTDTRVSMAELAKTYEPLQTVLTSQASELNKYVDEAAINKYLEELAKPFNEATLASLGADKASETNPVEITALIVNPKYDEDQKGWSGDNLTFNFDPSSVEKPHTAEKWNTNFNTYQTIYSLPVGTYRIQVQAIYRDGGGAQDAWNSWTNAAEEMEFWDNQNAKLYANKNETSICSMASYKSTTRSMDSFRDKMVEAPDADADGNIVWLEHWNYQFKNEVTDPETGEISYEDLDEENGKTDWWWDNKIYDDFEDEYYFYPASLWGISQRFEKSPEAYINSVEVYVEEGGSITFGIRKDTLIGGDWVVMDNWKLFYLGKEMTTGVQATKTAAQAGAIYSVSGVRQNSLQRGINIVKMSDGSVRKILK
ncbi:MAG: hypothetical protein KBT29_05990 [Prevotellaceae bacterium]|nr:hypothetical protein [Candidatus Minthosoma caballi]